MSLTGKCNNHRPHTNPWHREEETQSMFGGGVTSGPDPHPLENYKAIGFLTCSSTGMAPLKSHTATKPLFIGGPSSARQQNAIKMAFCWRHDDGSLLVVFGSSPLINLRINVVRVGPPLKNLSGSVHAEHKQSKHKLRQSARVSLAR